MEETQTQALEPPVAQSPPGAEPRRGTPDAASALPEDAGTPAKLVVAPRSAVRCASPSSNILSRTATAVAGGGTMAKDKLICNCNRTMPLDAKALAAALKLDAAPNIASELCRKHVAAFEAAVKNGGDLVVACTQEAPLFSELHEELKGSRQPEVRQYPRDRRLVGRCQSRHAQDRGTARARRPARARAGAGGVLQVRRAAAHHRPGWRGARVGRAAGGAVHGERAGDRMAARATKCRRNGAIRCFPGRPREVKGYLGAFEVEWEQANPIDLETCTRCNACIRVCPEQAIDYSYQIDLEKCKAHRQCVKACGEIRAIDFDRKETRRSDAFDMVLDLSREPLIRLPQPPQGYFAPRNDPLEQALAANQLARMVG